MADGQGPGQTQFVTHLDPRLHPYYLRMFTRACKTSSIPYALQRGLRTTAALSSSIPALPLDPPTFDQENEQFSQRCASVDNFFQQPRFAGIKRPYTASDVASKQGSLPPVPLPSTLLANKLFGTLKRAADEGKPVHTMGAIDPVQMTQMARYQEVVYVSGWASSSVLTTGNNEVGPDLG